VTLRSSEMGSLIKSYIWTFNFLTFNITTATTASAYSTVVQQNVTCLVKQVLHQFKDNILPQFTSK